MACKPGSVPWRTRVTTIHLRPALRTACCDLPGRQAETPVSCLFRPYSVLLQVGLAVPPSLRSGRCALTAPFHPYRNQGPGGLLSAALSLGFPPPDVIRHLVSVEPGLSSTTPFPDLLPRPSGHLIGRCHAPGGRPWSSAHRLRAGPCSAPPEPVRPASSTLPPPHTRQKWPAPPPTRNPPCRPPRPQPASTAARHRPPPVRHRTRP